MLVCRTITEADVTVREHGNLFNITASVTLLVLEDPEEFTCELKIPEANYTVRRETVYYPGKFINYPIGYHNIITGTSTYPHA